MYEITDIQLVEGTSMESLQLLISDHPDPVFITDPDRNQIVLANDSVVSTTQEYDVIDSFFDEVVYVEPVLANNSYAFFNKRWYQLQQHPFVWEGSDYLKVVLKQRPAVPGDQIMQIIRNMVAIMLHRFRSPLTGIQGYLNLLQQEMEAENVERRFETIAKGIDQLYDMMDDLEMLHNIMPDNKEYETYSVDVENLVNEILFSYSSDVRKRVVVTQSKGSTIFNCNPVNLEKILSILIQNAIEHTRGNTENITIDIRSSRCIQIAHGGEPIPTSIADRLFYPFVTSKANNLGIGLTMALLYAHQLRSSIFLTDNSRGEGISFTFCMPPAHI